MNFYSIDCGVQDFSASVQQLLCGQYPRLPHADSSGKQTALLEGDHVSVTGVSTTACHQSTHH